jgi:hypothetical protein
MAKAPASNTKQETPAIKNPSEPVRVDRLMQGEKTVFHDLFKLELATMKKNLSFTGGVELESVEHVHHFHTVDSNGKTQVRCGPVGGHFHNCKVVGTDENGHPKLEVGPAMKWVMKRVRGKKKLQPVAMPVEFFSNETEVDENGEVETTGSVVDNHTHKATYVRSSSVVQRKVNVEAAKMLATSAATQNPSIADVTERGV